jgi:hypothetical protein
MSLFLLNNQLSSSWFSLELFRCRAHVSRIRYYSWAARRKPVGNTPVPGTERAELTDSSDGTTVLQLIRCTLFATMIAVIPLRAD